VVIPAHKEIKMNSPLFKAFSDIANLADTMASYKPSFDYPKYNVYKDSETGAMKFSFAVAGFDKSEIQVSMAPGVIEVIGTPAKEAEAEDKNSLVWKGISSKPFHVKLAVPFSAEVSNAELKNGVLSFSVGDDISVKTKLIPIVG